MKKNLLLSAIFPLLLTACQEKPMSSDYYREHLDEAQKTEQKCKDMRAKGEEPSEILSKNCRLAHDVLFRRASSGAGIKNSE